VIARETKDRTEIESVLKHPEIYETITDDDCPPAHECVTTINENYKDIGSHVNSKIIDINV